MCSAVDTIPKGLKQINEHCASFLFLMTYYNSKINMPLAAAASPGKRAAIGLGSEGEGGKQCRRRLSGEAELGC